MAIVEKSYNHGCSRKSTLIDRPTPGISREIIPGRRPSLIDRHLPETSQVKRLLRREGKAHVFYDRPS